MTSLDATTAPRRRSAARGVGFDPAFRWICFTAATLVLTALVALILLLAWGGWPAFHTFGLSFFTSTNWNPVTDVYGAKGPIVGTLITSFLALLLALPIAFGVAVFLTEFAPRWMRTPLAIAVELLAGIPSIIYGMWGFFVFAPIFAKYVQLPLVMDAKPGSLLEKLTAGVPNGANIFTASVVLAIMILPFMASVFRQLFLSVPTHLRESAYGMGATPLEVSWSVVLPYVKTGAIGGVMLGLGRALGETMAVTYIIGNSHNMPKSLFDSGSTLASTIANEFNEATSPMHISALIACGCVLLMLTFVVLAAAQLLLGSYRREK